MNPATPPVDPASKSPEAGEHREAARAEGRPADREEAQTTAHEAERAPAAGSEAGAAPEGEASAADASEGAPRAESGETAGEPETVTTAGAAGAGALRRPVANVVARAEARLAAESEGDAPAKATATPAALPALESRATAAAAAEASPEAEAGASAAAGDLAAAALEAGTESQQESDAPPPGRDAPLQPEISLAAGAAQSAAAGTETLPIPAGPRRIDSRDVRPGKLNFWKRLAMRRSERARSAAQTAELLVKVGDLDERLEGAQARILGRLDRIEEQIDSVWVMEEQLSQLGEIQEKLESIRSEQRGIIEAVARSGSQTTGSGWGSRLAFVVLLAAAAAGAIALVRMGL